MGGDHLKTFYILGLIYGKNPVKYKNVYLSGYLFPPTPPIVHHTLGLRNVRTERVLKQTKKFCVMYK